MSNQLATVDKIDHMAVIRDPKAPIASRINSVGEIMNKNAAKMFAALPKHITPERITRVALNAIRKNPKLLDCDAASLFGSLIEASTYGWEIGGVIGHAYLVPYGKEAVLIPGYKGLVDLVRRSGQISTITCEVVHQGDDFRYSLGDDPKIHHKPNDADPKRDSKPITYVYLVVRMRDGGVQRSVWSSAKIEAHKEKYSQSWKRAESSGKKDSFWHTAWPQAAKKTLIRDMINRGLLPVSAEYRDAVDRGVKHDDDGEELDFGAFDNVPDMPAIEGEVDAGERPQTGDEPNPDIANGVDMDLGEVEGIGDCETVKAKWLKACHTEADRACVVGACDAKAEKIRASRGAGSNRK